MWINEIAAHTGLSKKAIRFYESKGLLQISRSENGYRTYSEADALQLNKIKLLRMAGVSLSDIKLFFDQVITAEELFQKRRCEIEAETGKNSTQIDSFLHYMAMYQQEQSGKDLPFSENDTWGEADPDDHLAVGIDIGTTTLSAAILNLTKQQFAEFYTLPNDCKIPDPPSGFALQDPEKILTKVKSLLGHIIRSYPNTKAIGITGQMHGILYLDKEGKPCSDFMTWQDKRADRIAQGDLTYCEEIFAKTGYRVASGYGFATHYHNKQNGLVPKNAVTFCNITDFTAMALTERKAPLIHSSMAASFGCFDLQSRSFDRTALERLGIDDLTLPEVTNTFALCGSFQGIPVSVAIGDNQASFFGSVSDPEHSLLINIGTGSQISMRSDRWDGGNDTVEVRPLANGHTLLCGCALCGGASYALLERFFRAYQAAATGADTPQFEVLNQLAREAYQEGKPPLSVCTAFKGKRSDPSAQGGILGITEENFTPGQLALGILYGMCRELQDCFPTLPPDKTTVIASGNAIQKNPLLSRILTELFHLPVKLSQNKEEAAVGSALFASVAAGVISEESKFGAFISYQEQGDENT